VRAVCAELRSRDRWLLIFGNAEDPAHVRPVVPGGPGHVLITTRRGGFGYLGPVLDLDGLPRDQGVTLLQRRVPQLSDEHAHELAEVLGDLPLALEQATGYLDQTRLPAAEYLHLLRTHAPKMFTRGRVLDHQDTIATLWSLTLQRLRDAQPAAVQLATICAYLAPEPIPLDLITGHPNHLPSPLREVAADAAELADTVGVLLDYGLARRVDCGLVLHRLTQTVLRHTSLDLSLMSTALTLLRAELPEEIEAAPQNWPRWRQLLSHVLAATDHPDTTAINPDITAWLLDRAATYQHTHGHPAAARPLFERALRIREASYGPDHPEVATTLHNLAWTLRKLGRPAQAQPLAERALRIREASYGPDHPWVATTLYNLARTLRELGRPAQAQPLAGRVLSIREASYGLDHSSTRWSRQVPQSLDDEAPFAVDTEGAT
jgi:tetratricopeptide (TPR) repeat protein